jgi:hypothetical protein
MTGAEGATFPYLLSYNIWYKFPSKATLQIVGLKLNKEENSRSVMSL